MYLQPQRNEHTRKVRSHQVGALTRMSIRPYETLLQGKTLALLVFAVLVSLLGSSGFAQAQGDPAQLPLSFPGDPLTLHLKEGEEEIPARVTIRNGSSRSVELEFSTVMRESTGTKFVAEAKPKPDEPTSVRPKSVAAFDLEMEAGQFEGLALPLQGFLVVSGTEIDGSGGTLGELAPATLPVTLNKVAPRPALLKTEYGPVSTRTLVLFVPLLISAIAVALSYRWFLSRTEDGRVYAPLFGERSALGTGLSFDPAKSWATVVAGVAALLTAFAGAQVFPETRALFTSKDVSVLALSFGGFLFVGPAIYNGIRWRNVPKVPPLDGEKKPGQPQVPTLGGEMELKGYVSTLLVTSTVILGALLGQLVLVFLLINEIDNANVTTTVRWTLWILTGASMVYTILYVAKGIVSCLRAEVRWGQELQEARTTLAQEIVKLRRQRSDLERKARRTKEQSEKLESIRKDMRAKRRELERLQEQQKVGTYPRRLTTL